MRNSIHLVRLSAFDPTRVCASFATAGAKCNWVTVTAFFVGPLHLSSQSGWLSKVLEGRKGGPR